jgi:ribosome-associated protein
MILKMNAMSEYEPEYIEIELEEEPIELCNLLKVLDLAETGGQAKQLIADGYVGVNMELCTVKRKKMYSGDSLHFNGEDFLLTLAEGVTPAVKAEPTPPIEEAPTKRKRSRSRKNKKRQRYRSPSYLFWLTNSR